MQHSHDAAQQNHGTNDAARTILVVDDDIALLGILTAMLNQAGYRVLTATNGTQALAVVQQTPVLLILTDRSMPQFTGVELGRQLRSDPYTAEIPLVLMSSVPPADISLFAAFLQKPFTREALLACIQRCQET